MVHPSTRPARRAWQEDPNNSFGLGSNTGNPNRIKLVFAPGLTQNAERIELFLNTRESEAPSPDLFYTAEEMRQVTFSRSGSVNGEYAHFASYRRLPSGNVDMTVLTAVYSDPLQLERFVVKVGPNRPLILFSHQLALSRACRTDVQLLEVGIFHEATYECVLANVPDRVVAYVQMCQC